VSAKLLPLYMLIQLLVYTAALADVRREVEALPEWLRLSDDDRQDVGLRLTVDVPGSPQPGQEIALLRRVLVRGAGIDRLRRDLKQEIRRRLPADVAVHDGIGPGMPVDFNLSLLPPEIVRTPEDLDPWFAALRAAVVNALQSGAPLRLRMRQ